MYYIIYSRGLHFTMLILCTLYNVHCAQYEHCEVQCS